MTEIYSNSKQDQLDIDQKARQILDLIINTARTLETTPCANWQKLITIGLGVITLADNRANLVVTFRPGSKAPILRAQVESPGVKIFGHNPFVNHCGRVDFPLDPSEKPRFIAYRTSRHNGRRRIEPDVHQMDKLARIVPSPLEAIGCLVASGHLTIAQLEKLFAQALPAR